MSEFQESGVLIRVNIDGKWQAVDIADPILTPEEVTLWLRSRGGYNPFCENLLLAFINKDQVAHKEPFTIEVGEATYEHQGNHMSVTCHEEGMTVMTACGGDATSCDVPITDPRIYNALMLLISGIQVHYAEKKDPDRSAGLGRTID